VYKFIPINTPETAELDEDTCTSFEDAYQAMNAAIDDYRQDDLDYETKLFMSSGHADNSIELPF
jgi:hypothetical protein